MTHTVHEELTNWLEHHPQTKNAHMRRIVIGLRLFHLEKVEFIRTTIFAAEEGDHERNDAFELIIRILVYSKKVASRE